MKVFFIGVSVRRGVSKKGNDYEISKLFYGVPAESKTTDAYRYVAYGMEVREVDLNPASVHEFSDIVPGTEVDLVVEPKGNNLSRNWVVGYK
jgi:hypothetical protein